MKLSRATLIPGLLLIYLAVMSAMGWKEYAAGRTTPMEYFGVIALTLGIIVLLHFSIKRRERLRRERLDDMAGQHDDNNESTETKL